MSVSINGTTLTFNDSTTQNTAATGFGFKNRLINGAMVIDQRNAGASVTVPSNTPVYTLDRWIFQPVSASMSIQRIGSSGGPFSIQINGNAGSAGFNLIQKIESYNVSDLASQTVTLSFTISSTVLTTAAAYYQTPTSQDNFSSLNTLTAIGSFSISSTPTQKSLTFTLPASAVNGLQLYVINAGALTSGTVTITNVQLEKGPTATAFDGRPYGTELGLCQRYYEKSYDISFPPGTATNGGASATFSQLYVNNSLSASQAQKYSVCKRTTATVTLYSTSTGASGKVYDATFAQDVAGAVYINGQSSFGWYATTYAATTSINFTVMWAASAEL